MTAGVRSMGPALRARRAAAASRVIAQPRVNVIIRCALYLFVFSIPFEMPNRTIPLEIPTLTGTVFLLTTILQPSICYRSLPPAVLWFVGYLWAFGMAVALSGLQHPRLVGELFVWMLQVVLLFWIVANLLADDRSMRGVLLSLIVACALRAVLQVAGIGVTADEVYTGGARVSVFGQNTNLTGMILAAGIAATVGLQMTRDRRLPRLHLLTWPIVALIAWAVIQSGSRGGLLSVAVALGVFLFRGKGMGQRIRNGVLAIALLGLLAWGAFRSEVMHNRFEAAATEGHLAGREEIYPALASMFRERPWLGWGPIANQFEIARRIEDPTRPRRDAHNLVGELLTSGGLFIAVPFLIGMALCIRAAWRARRGRYELVPLAMLCAVLVGTVSGTWIASKILWLALAVALGAGTYWAQPSQPAQAGGRGRVSKGVMSCAV